MYDPASIAFRAGAALRRALRLPSKRRAPAPITAPPDRAEVVARTDMPTEDKLFGPPRLRERREGTSPADRRLVYRILAGLDRSESNLVKAARDVLARRAAEVAVRETLSEPEVGALSRRSTSEDPDDVVVRGIGKGLSAAIRRLRAREAAEKALRDTLSAPEAEAPDAEPER